MDIEPSGRLSRKEAAQYLKSKHGIRASTATLAKLACIGGGPAFRREGRFPVYEAVDLDEWAEKRLSKKVHSTSELPPLRTAA
jgi:hypothetical protein